MNIVPTLVLGSTLVLAFPLVAADAGSIIKQRARNVANPQPPAQPAPQPPAARPIQPISPAARPAVLVSTNVASTPALTAAQEAQIKQVLSDLNAIKPGAKPTPAQTTKVKDSLTTLNDVAVKPTEEDVARLANALTVAWGTQKMTTAEQLRFVKDLRRVLNYSALPAGEAEAAVKGAGTLLRYSGVAENTAEQIVAMLKDIASRTAE
jgi:hypothetical protein